MAADQAAIIADFPDSVRIDGIDYTVAASGVQSGQQLEIAGMMLDVTFQFTGVTSVISAVAVMNKRVTYKGGKYRIARVFPDNTGAGTTCYCVDESK